jgi:protein-S-isoprenylcysteine O-methyltransferase Ste14
VIGAGGRYSPGVKDLGNSLTPFPKPRADNLLKMKGSYSVVRHPMYSGLAFGAFGAAIVTGSPVRTILAVLLAVLLNFKAASEEDYLADMHGAEVYGDYADKVPRLIPTVEGLGRLLEETFDGSFSEEGKNKNKY